MNVHEVLESGPIIASDEDMALLVTVNGAFFTVWAEGAPGDWDNVDAFDVASRVADDPSTWRGLYGADMARVMDAGAELLASIVDGSLFDDEEEDEEEENE